MVGTGQEESVPTMESSLENTTFPPTVHPALYVDLFDILPAFTLSMFSVCGRVCPSPLVFTMDGSLREERGSRFVCVSETLGNWVCWVAHRSTSGG